MSTLGQAVGEYLSMRRDLGFKLKEAGKGLHDFVAFMQQRSAAYVTQALALAWAQQPTGAQLYSMAVWCAGTTRYLPPFSCRRKNARLPWV